MRRLVLLQVPLGQIDRVHVRVGESTVERATGLRPEMIAELFHDDLAAIEKAMIRC